MPKLTAKVAQKLKQSVKQTPAAAVPKVQPGCSEWPCGALGWEEWEEEDPDGPFWEGRFRRLPCRLLFGRLCFRLKVLNLGLSGSRGRGFEGSRGRGVEESRVQV